MKPTKGKVKDSWKKLGMDWLKWLEQNKELSLESLQKISEEFDSLRSRARALRAAERRKGGHK